MKKFEVELIKLGKDVKWLAEKLNISHQAVYDWKLGKTKPTPKNILKISKILNIKVDLLIEEFYR